MKPFPSLVVLIAAVCAPHASAAGPILLKLTGYVQASVGSQQVNTNFVWTATVDTAAINNLSPGVLASPATSSDLTLVGFGGGGISGVPITLNTNSGQITFGNPSQGGITFTNQALKQFDLKSPTGVLMGTLSAAPGAIAGTGTPPLTIVSVNSPAGAASPTFQATLPVPGITSVTNAASNIVPGLPNAAIAQGSVFLLFGTGLGPSSLFTAPVPFQNTNLGGTAVTVTVGGNTVNVPLYYSSATQVAALLPSTMPTGTGTLTASYNGVASASVPITVVASNVGIFTVGSNGQGPAIVTYPDYSLVSAAKAGNCGGPDTTCGAANPGDTLILWATGLGPVTGNEVAGAGLGMNMPAIPLTVWVGGVQAAVSYQGRSGCCVGEDQIVFTVPQNVPTGCAVPLAVQIGNYVSNYTSMPVAAAGDRSCTTSNPALAQVDIEHDVNAGPVTYGQITLARNSSSSGGFTDNISFKLLKLTGYAPGVQPFFASYLDNPPLGTCTVANVLNPSTVPPITGFSPAAAGSSFTVTGPNGVQMVPVTQGIVTDVLSANGTYLSPGTYTVSGTGGADIGAIDATATISASPSLNTPSLSSRAAGTTVTWTGGQPDAFIEIQIAAATDKTGSNGATAICYAASSAGMLTIPPSVMLALPATNFGSFQFQQGTLNAITASGLNLGQLETLNAPTIVPFTSQ